MAGADILHIPPDISQENVDQSRSVHSPSNQFCQKCNRHLPKKTLSPPLLCNTRFKTLRGRNLSHATLMRYLTCFVLLWLLGATCQSLTVEELRKFPLPQNVAKQRPIITIPSASTCGITSQNAYCVSTENKVQQCEQKFCEQACGENSRTDLPDIYTKLLSATTSGMPDCVAADTVNIRPGSKAPASTPTLSPYSTYIFASGAKCFMTSATSPSSGIDGSFTLTAWIWIGQNVSGTLVDKTTPGGVLILQVQVGPKEVTVQFVSQAGYQTATLVHPIPEKSWTHLAVQVYMEKVSFFINGTGQDFMPISTVSVGDEIADTAGTFRLGQSANGTGQFIGKMQDVYFFTTTLSNREIQEVYSGTIPAVRIQSSCRCPPATPHVKPQDTKFCLSNGVLDNAGDATLRISDTSHPVEYANDGDVNTIWISDFKKKVELEVDLGDQFEVFHVGLEFYSPPPKAIVIQRIYDGSDSFQPWQYYADNCTHYFGMTPNGTLETENSVNCVQFDPNYIPYSKGIVTFTVVSTTRPGYTEYYSSPTLQQFVQASRVRVLFEDHYYSYNIRHEYFALFELRVSGRCGCNGHATSCSMDTFPYKCDCTEDSHTQGDRCNECQPLYNMKPFRQGELKETYNCMYCDCHNHSDSCVYNASLDLNPSSWTEGGGGVCVNCRDNTEGRFCDRCIDGYYRPDGKSLYVPDMCSPCACSPAGTLNAQTVCNKEGGQCPCKASVTGRACDQCVAGSYNLQATDIDGCTPCNCVKNGIINPRDMSCNQTTGNCFCKQNVRGVQCDACEYGYFNLEEDNPYGCAACGCNAQGSLSMECNPIGGQCQCKPNVEGVKCNECVDNYYNFSAGCLPCNCESLGTTADTTCDKNTGQCVCKLYTSGRQCSECKTGSSGFGSSPEFGCQRCQCDEKGIAGNSSDCSIGCTCKQNVEGANCNLCKANFFNLSKDNELGCQPCNCDPTGVSDNSCDANGQCTCLQYRIGDRCESCISGTYKSNFTKGGCLQCQCDSGGEVLGSTCDSNTGECVCKTSDGVGGALCDTCIPGYHSFTAGKCSPCDCSPAGSKSLICNQTGNCDCKTFTTPPNCQTCVEGASNLRPDNPDGCSKTPFQQPPPSHKPLSPTSMEIFWSAPDYPNGIIIRYDLFRNNTLVYNGTGQSFVDTKLHPYTQYSYFVRATNDAGGESSPSVLFRTNPGIPSSDMKLHVDDIQDSSANFSWTLPTQMNGPLMEYQLISHNPTNDTDKTILWTGKNTRAVVGSLGPYQSYYITVKACTDGGCSESGNVSFITKPAAPANMEPPTITVLNSTALYVEWKPPRNPNGIITMYELWIRGTMGQAPAERRIFDTIGQYDPLHSGQNIMQPPDTFFTVTGLQPFTAYEFQVVAQNEAGRAASIWKASRTKETYPVFMPAPTVTGLSSSALEVKWTSPTISQARGNITSYRVHQSMTRNLAENPFGSPIYWLLIKQTDGQARSVEVSDLKPYTTYTFMVEACNSVGCVNSAASSGRTLAAAPEGMAKPIIDSYNSTVMEVKWDPPASPNGPTPTYTVQKTNIALSYPASVVRGTRFPGGGYYAFPTDTLPQNVDFTGIRFEFRLKKASGLLLFAASEDHQEYVAVIFNSGRPRFMFDTQGLCEVEVADSDVNLTTLADSQVHTVKLVRKDGNDGSVIVDGIKTGCENFAGVSTFDDEGLVYNDNKWHHFKTIRFGGVHANVTIDHKWKGCKKFHGVYTHNDEGLRYDRGDRWHSFRAERRGISGSVVVDEKWIGNNSIRDLSCKDSKIIGLSTKVFIGGVPPDFVFQRNDPRMNKVIGQSFQGCIHKVEVLKQVYPEEVWEELNWANAVSYELAFLNWQGCPINLETGVHFMGKGYAALPLCGTRSCLLDKASASMKITFKLRTALETGLLFVVHGGKGIYILAYMQQNSIVFEFNNNAFKTEVRYTNTTNHLCDGQWHSLEFLKVNSQGSITVDGERKSVSGNSLQIKPLFVTSPIYLGGVKPNSAMSAWFDNNDISVPTEGFGGCMKEIRFGDVTDTEAADMSNVVDIVNINLDGCPPFHVPKDTCKDSLIADIYAGTDTTAYDYGLLPYTDYIYRVVAKNTLGEASSPWGYGRTREGAPVGVGPPTSAQALSGYLVEVTWEEPQSTSGLLIKTIISAYSMDDPEQMPISEEVLDINLQSINLTDLTPNTNYRIKISACTSGGCTESVEGADVRTPVEAPEEVAAPRATAATATTIQVSWDPPSKPNGNITGYFLYRDGSTIYEGGETQVLVTQLRVYTSYQFYIRACTVAGCSFGPQESLSTAQLPPTEVKKPVLTVLGASSIEVKWEKPEMLNGVLERYLIYLSTVEGQMGTAVRNTTITLPNYALTELTAGTTYYISVGACTGGGCTVSNASVAKTFESSPGGIANPVVTSPSSSQLVITWEPPEFPNGVITYYALYQNDVVITRTSGQSYQLNNLQPYSLHVFRLQVCTTEGCGSSEEVPARTQEAPPQGVVVLDTAIVDARTISVNWTQPEKPNGLLYYDVYFEGYFYADPANWNYTTVKDRRSLLRETTAYTTFQIQQLIPRVYYEVRVNASNTKGFILSNARFLTMPSGSPDGMKPPEVVSDSSGSMIVSWQPVGRVNGDDSDKVAYLVQFRQNEDDNIIDDYGPTTTTSYKKTGLTPFTSYQFRVVASNSHGSTPSLWVTKTTIPDKPSGVSAPVIAAVETRSILLEWSSPTYPNGIITTYKVYQSDQLVEELSGNVTSYTVTGLTPYQLYVFKMEACTVAGCTLSLPSVSVYTQQAIPDGIAAPVLKVLTPSSIEVQWSTPLGPNGVISRYIIERKLANGTAVSTVGMFLPSAEKRYIDDSADLSPFTTYSYRVKVVNGIGEGVGPWANATTSSSRPAGVTPPQLTVIDATSIRVKWSKPLQPNGNIEYYLLQWAGGRTEHRNFSDLSAVLSDLTPYTQYSVRVAACTNGGCTESTSTAATTLTAVPSGQAAPTATAISQSAVSVLWSPPSSPNGPNLNYELARRLIRQPLNSTVPQPGVYTRVYYGTALFYEDKGLPMFTTFTYRVTTFNDVGQTISSDSKEVTTFGGFPQKAPLVTAKPLSHLEIFVNWTMPDPVELQGEAQLLNLTARSKLGTAVIVERPAVGATNFTLQNLSPSTQYSITLKVVIFGGASIVSDPVIVTTLDGAPEGIPAPVLAIISNTALRVTWIAPKEPNGVITSYNLIVNGENIPTGFTMPGSKILDKLEPYTVYEIKVEACTEFQCGQSESTFGTTAEALPMGMASPILTPFNATKIQVDWQPPTRPNGIVLRYELWRRTVQNCTKVPTPEVNPEDSKCTYVECGVLNSVCGSRCYTGAKTCCDGELYDTQPGYECCSTNYIPRPSATSVCCAGKFYEPKANFSCCGQRYLQVLPNEVCCMSPVEDRVAVSQGDSCCGGVPYSSSGSQICCDDALVDGYGRQCCGGHIVNSSSVCCGNATAGQVYMLQSGYTCCGQIYANSATSLCCGSDTGHTKVHHYENELQKSAANEVCCGLETISAGLSCCNYVGYNPATQICADRSTQITGCGTGVVCPITQASQAFCNRCDFNTATTTCGFMAGHRTDLTTPAPSTDSSCSTEEVKIYSGQALSYADDYLMPHHKYQYSVRVVNSAGTTSSPYVEAETLEAPPAGVAPPVAHINPEQLQIIYLSWSEPRLPNGKIIRYILLRDGIELYRGLGTNFTDDGNVLPYKTYSYMLTACTAAGCSNSPGVTVATAQGVPEDLKAPEVTVLTSNSMLVSIQPPGKPNGEVIRYTVLVEGKEEKYSVSSPQRIALGGLEPYTSYTVYVEVCTLMGCADSPKVTVTTMEAVPEGVDPPTVVVMTASSVNVYWKPPNTLNGQLQAYTIILQDINSEKSVYRGPNLNATVSDLSPGRRYNFILNVSTNGGTTRSQPTAITMPTKTPLSVPPPQTVTVLSSSEISVEWLAVTSTEGTIDQYIVLLNLGQDTESITGVGTETSLKLSGLQAYTEYTVRLQACLEGVSNGCGTSSGVVRRTHEAPPAGQAPPTLTALASNSIKIEWKEPASPNGIITYYHIFQRAGGETENEILVDQVGGDTFTVTHTGPDLKPYTLYQYGVRALNSKGQTPVSYSSVRTLQSPPVGLNSPSVSATGAYSIAVSWAPPSKPNGIISKYKVHYKTGQTGPESSVTVDGSTTSTAISSLEPYSLYTIRIEAVNDAGSVSSLPVEISTKQSSPSGLRDFSVEKITTGDAVILRWDPPLKPNGIITIYRVFEVGNENSVYSGVARIFEYRRLQPYTEYFVKLEACTMAGCTLGEVQKFITAEIPPTAQSIPSLGTVTATSVVLRWAAPLNANGKITTFEVIRKASPIIRRKRDADSSTGSAEEVVYRTMDTDADTYEYTDTGLQPYTQYQYKVRASNTKGSTDSPWQTVQTSQAAPEGVSPPQATHVDGDVNSLKVSWSIPTSPNGVLQSYRLQRNDSIPLSLPPDGDLEYVYSSLQPYTWYSFTLTVCSGGGCTTSDPTLIRTKEAAPLSVSPPELSAVDATSIKATWMTPQVSNGEISLYNLSIDDVVAYSGLEKEYTATGLVPYKVYSFHLTACTEGGCTQSEAVVGRPEDSPPADLDPPVLRVISSTAIEISWSPPKSPNGVISSYDVRRDGNMVFTDSTTPDGALVTVYTENGLQPGESYTYTIIAHNRKGSVESAPSSAKTYPTAPAGLDPPRLTPLSSTTIQAEWTAPIKPNGLIVNYTLYKGNQLAYSGDQLKYEVPDLSFFTQYTFRVEACTLRGCALSLPNTAMTQEALPQQMNAPVLRALAGETGAHKAVYVKWAPPVKPNGIVLYYELQRRIVMPSEAGVDYGDVMLVYNGTGLEVSDEDTRVLPYQRYQYMVMVFNAAGKALSPWADVTTKQAPPTTVDPPTITETTATTITVTITVPQQPNGIVNLYSVLIDGNVRASGLSLQLTAGQAIPLVPFTNYSVSAQACTSGGCTDSTGVIATTAAAQPSGLQPLEISDSGSATITLAWKPPLKPNGKITRYLVYQRTACPPPPQPFTQACSVSAVKQVYEGLDTSTVVSGLTAYSNYQFMLQVENQMGQLDFPQWVSGSTIATVPQYINKPDMLKNESHAIIDWTNSFALNGFLREYMMRKEGYLLYRGIGSMHSIHRSSRNEVITFELEAITEVGNAVSEPLIFDPSMTNNEGTTQAPVVEKETPFYEEVWFIIVVIIVLLLLLFILLAICLCRTGPKEPYIRERIPLPPEHRKLPRDLYVIDATDGTVIDATLSPEAMSGRNTLYQGPGIGMVNPAFDSTLPGLQTLSLHGSKTSMKGLDDDDDDITWDRNFDSGLFDTDDDVDSLDNPAYSYTKEQTVFTDTHL